MIWGIAAGIVVFLLVFFGVYDVTRKVLAAICFGLLFGGIAGIIVVVVESFSFWF